MMKLPIKLRLCLGVTAVSALLLGLSVTLMLLSTRELLLREARAKVLGAAREAADEAWLVNGVLQIEEDIVYYRDGITVTLHWPDGSVAAGRPPLLFPKEITTSLSEQRELALNNHNWLLLDYPGEDGLFARAVMPLTEIEYTMRMLIWIAISAFLVMTLLMALLGYRVCVRAFRPIERINALAESITGGDQLDRRIPDPPAKDEIAELAGHFNAMIERLEQAFAKEKQFTSDASHELRTPVSVIMAQCEEGLQSETLEQAHTALKESLNQTRHMSRLLDQLLTFARAENLPLKLERLDLGELMDLVADEFADSTRADGVELRRTIDKGVFVYGDQTMLLRALINLVDNALRYQRADEPCPFVHMRVYRQGGEAVAEVEDNGMGIPPEHLDSIWERFYRAGGTKTSRQGMGIGLSLVRRIARDHGGEAEVESASGRGSRFIIKLSAIDECDAAGHRF